MLKNDTSWCWEISQQRAFKNMKKELCAAPSLSYFDKPMIFSADSSSYAIGGVLLKKHGRVLRTVAYCSRSLNNTGRNYAQIEKELLALLYVCEKFRIYVLGAELTLQPDQKPLNPLIKKKSLCDAPAHCQRLLMRLARYSPHAEYVPGKYMVLAVMLSSFLEFKF